MIPITEFKGEAVGVFGLGVSGRANLAALAAGEAKVWAWDDSENSRAAASREGVECIEPSQWPWDEMKALVLSPGVPLDFPKPHAIVTRAQSHDVEIVSDIELFARAVNATPLHERPKVIAVTGTNGKSTTVALIGHILNACGVDARVGGNIGEAVLSLEPLARNAVYVLELSSYQLAMTQSLRANVAMLLNVSPDHLDRHGGFDGYVKAKKRIFLNQSETDLAVVGVDDETTQCICTKMNSDASRQLTPISSGAALGRGVFAVDGVLFDCREARALEVADLGETKTLRGAHNWQNAAAAYAACHAVFPQSDQIASAMKTFPGLPHRLEEAALSEGVAFINDSKATNPDAAARALMSFDQVYWIAGGRAKDGGFEELEPHFSRIKQAFLIGEAAGVLKAAIGDAAPSEVCETVERAVAQAGAAARKAIKDGAEEAVVLFSPGCASFDQYRNFELRGDAFRDAVARFLTENGAAA